MGKDSPQRRLESAFTLGCGLPRSLEEVPLGRSNTRERWGTVCGDVGRAALGALAQFIGPELLEDVKQALGDASWRVRREAAVVLARSGLAGAIPPLCQVLADGYWQVQKEAALALGKLNATAAVSDLVALLENGEADLRRAAALALGEIRAPRARPALLPLLADPHVDVRKAARLALATLAADGPLDGVG